jgi:hypothetical protein
MPRLMYSVMLAAMTNEPNERGRPKGLLATIMSDIHFWIPALVLLAGLIVLHKLS